MVNTICKIEEFDDFIFEFCVLFLLDFFKKIIRIIHDKKLFRNFSFIKCERRSFSRDTYRRFLCTCIHFLSWSSSINDIINRKIGIIIINFQLFSSGAQHPRIYKRVRRKRRRSCTRLY